MSKRLFSQSTIAEDLDQDNSRAAIPLSKSTPDLVNGIPVSGEDYLLVVRQQANKCAKTVVAERPKEVKKLNLPSHFQFFMNNDSNVEDQASDIWRKGFTTPFKSFQKAMQNKKNGIKQRKEVSAIEEGHKLLYSKDQDLVQLLPTLSQHTILRLLKFHVQWISDQKELESQCLTIFGLLVYLDPVLTSKNISILRDLSRECIKIRTSLPDQIIPLNIIITIIADSFGQADLL